MQVVALLPLARIGLKRGTPRCPLGSDRLMASTGRLLAIVLDRGQTLWAANGRPCWRRAAVFLAALLLHGGGFLLAVG